MDELLAKAAEAMGMPEAMVRRSAEARAKAEGRAVEEVLADWAGVAPPDAGTEPAEPEPEPEAPEAAAEAAPVEEVEKPPASGVERFVEMAAENLAMPASMIRRSAEARARAEGRTYEEVLAGWAEVDVAVVRTSAEAPEEAAAEAPEEAAAEPAPASEAVAAEPSAGEEPPAAEAEEGPPAEEPSVEEPAVEVIGGDEEPALEEGADEGADEEPEAELVAAGSGIPRWLLSLFVIIPAFAVGYAAFLPNGPSCGDAGRLAVDPVTGVAVECDGSPYGERVGDFFAMGAQLFSPCGACHGPGGGGTTSGPAFVGELMATFPEGQCEVHVEWVRVGTAGWPDPTYGATEKPVGGFGANMPAFGTGAAALTEEELRSVVLYERVRFGDQPLQEATVDCGLVESEDDGDEVGEPEDGDPANGDSEDEESG